MESKSVDELFQELKNAREYASALEQLLRARLIDQRIDEVLSCSEDFLEYEIRHIRQQFSFEPESSSDATNNELKITRLCYDRQALYKAYSDAKGIQRDSRHEMEEKSNGKAFVRMSFGSAVGVFQGRESSDDTEDLSSPQSQSGFRWGGLGRNIGGNNSSTRSLGTTTSAITTASSGTNVSPRRRNQNVERISRTVHGRIPLNLAHSRFGRMLQLAKKQQKAQQQEFLLREVTKIEHGRLKLLSVEKKVDNNENLHLRHTIHGDGRDSSIRNFLAQLTRQGSTSSLRTTADGGKATPRLNVCYGSRERISKFDSPEMDPEKYTLEQNKEQRERERLAEWLEQQQRQCGYQKPRLPSFLAKKNVVSVKGGERYNRSTNGSAGEDSISYLSGDDDSVLSGASSFSARSCTSLPLGSRFTSALERRRHDRQEKRNSKRQQARGRAKGNAKERFPSITEDTLLTSGEITHGLEPEGKTGMRKSQVDSVSVNSNGTSSTGNGTANDHAGTSSATNNSTQWIDRLKLNPVKWGDGNQMEDDESYEAAEEEDEYAHINDLSMGELLSVGGDSNVLESQLKRNSNITPKNGSNVEKLDVSIGRSRAIRSS